MVYSLDGKDYSPSIPKAKDADTYTVYFKAQGDSNHTDSDVKSTTVTIDQQHVETPQIELKPSKVQYDGNPKTPDEVTVRDSANNVIPTSEYKVTFVADGGENWTETGSYTVKIEDISGGNYMIDTETATFTISTTPQNPLEIVNKPGLVYYGDTFTLSAVGGSGNEKVIWSADPAGIVEIDDNGFVKVVGTGSTTITATKPGGTNYNEVKATYPLNALKKPITAIVTADDKMYDGEIPAKATIHVTWKDGDLVENDKINTSNLVGTFADEKVGTNKAVTIIGNPVSDLTSQKYVITIPRTVTASIFKADAAVPSVTAVSGLKYTGSAQSLVSGGDDNTVYSDARDGVYSTTVPTGTNAGTYTVWYKAKGDASYNESAPQAVTVEIARKELEMPAITLSGNDLQTDNSTTPPTYSYTYDNTEKRPTVTIKDGEAVVPASEYTVSYSDNKNAGDATITITCNAGGNYTFEEKTVSFTITSAGAQLMSSPQAKDLTYTGQPQELVTVGTATGGHIEYSTDGGGTYRKNIPTGTTAGTYTVTYTVVGDGNYASGTDTWTVSVTIKPKEIVSPVVEVSGSFIYDGNTKEPGNANVEVKDGTTVIPSTEYTLSYRDNINAGPATVVVTNANRGNYIVNGTGTFTIAKGTASVAEAPKGKTDLPYNGTAQELIEAGRASDGSTMVYSRSENGTYSTVIPTAKNVGTYTVYYKAQGNSNLNDSAPQSVTASIAQNTVTKPIIQVTPESVTFNGQKQGPTVTVKDDNGFVIDGDEYTVSYADAEGNAVTDPTNVGKYTPTITSKADGNYTFTFTEKPTFEILPADQMPLTITGTRENVYYGDKIQLSTTGGSGMVTWEVGDSTIATITNGLLEITGVGSVTVMATSKADGHKDQTATWPLYAEKKPVTAVVSAESKTYDSKTDATVTATLQSSDLVGDDDVTIKLVGTFDDPNAGTDKKVNVDSRNPDFTGSSATYVNYNITYPATTTASIFKANLTDADVTPPAVKTGLVYTGDPQALVSAGTSTEGILGYEYSTDNITYSASLPTGTNAGSYDVWYRVKGDSNHNDTAGTPLAAQVTIAQQTVDHPIIEFAPNGASYDGGVHTPDVTVKDNNGRPIPNSEYKVDYGTSDWTKAGDHKVLVKDNDANGNYIIPDTEGTFTIHAMGQSPLSIVNQPSGVIRYGDTFTLSAVGGSGTGTIKWQVSDGSGIASIDQNGLVKVTGTGAVTIRATKLADGNYGEVSDTWTFSAEKKPVTAVVTAKDKVFDTNDRADLEIAWKAGDLLDGDTITLNLTGKFNNANVGENKTVTITGDVPDSNQYAISYNTTTTASITPAAAVVTAPTPIQGLTYSSRLQPLVNAGAATNGTILYSLDGIVYGPNIPEGKNAGPYTVWYKVTGDENYKNVAPDVIPVTIAQKEVTNPTIELSGDTFDYDGSAKRPDVIAVKDNSTVIPASEYTVGYSNNVNAGNNATVTIINADGGNYIVSGTKTFTIKSGTATLTLPPEEKDLTYTGSAQPLVRPGTAVNGQVMYSLDGVDYSTSIPKETNAGNYEVWYKVKGNDGYGDTAAQSLTVTIKPKQLTPTILVGGVPNYSTPYTSGPIEPSLTVIADGKILTNLVDYYASYSSSTNFNPGTATVTVISLGSNYQFVAVASFEITKAKAEFAAPPRAVTDLVYTGEAQKLVKAGVSKTGGTVVYSLDGRTYSPSIPKGTERDDYVVFAKVLGNETYTDSDVVYVDVTIDKNPVTNPKVELSSNSFTYTGGEHKPTVTLTDNDGKVIPASEYTVNYSNNIGVGEASVTVKSQGHNYSFQKTVTFQITDAKQPALTITGKPTDKVCYGDTFQLSTTGGSGNGAVTWEPTGPVDNLGGGQFKITSSGSVTITATKAGDGGTDTWQFHAYPKSVTAVVTAESKPHDNSPTATLTVTVNSGLVSGDTVTTVTAEGHFVDASVGTNKTVIIDSVTIPPEVSKKYDISYPATTTASITPAAATVTDPPKKAENLKYTGQPYDLVIGGEATGGSIAYSLDGASYSYAVPTGTNAGKYTFWYKALADENHKDSTPVKMEVEIARNTGTPEVVCSPSRLSYDSTEKTLTVIVLDSEKREIPESEYIVELPSPRIEVGVYTVTVKDRSGSGNYEFTPVTGTFEIVAASQNPLSIVTDIPTNIHYGDTFRLSAIGGSGGGAIIWKSTNTSVATITDGVVTVTGIGDFTIEAYRKGAGGYSDSNTDSVPFYADRKPVTPVVTADDKPYDGSKTATLHVTWKTGDLVGDTIALTVEGEFVSSDVGTNKAVAITSKGPVGEFGNYLITWPDSTTASIYKVDAQIASAPQPNPDGLTYTGEAQPLVSTGTTANGIGKIVYSLSQNGAYSENVPEATNADKYTVWYKVADSVNYTGIAAASVEVEIKKATPTIVTAPTASEITSGQPLSASKLTGNNAGGVPGSFDWAKEVETPVSGSYDVIFTPDDTANYNTYTFKVSVTVTDGSSNPGSSELPDTNQTPVANTSSTVNASMQTTVRNGTASTVLNTAAGSKLVSEAAANKSQNVVIKPEITGDVTKTEVSIPASTVGQLKRETNAALTVSTPVADVTLPSAALSTLSSAGGTVDVVTEQAEQGVTLALTAGGKSVENVPGGVTLSVPVENAGPGTVAVLVHDDGTRETLRKSVVEDDKMSIPLNGSATVEIVDNSKTFTDVPSTSWVSDAVAFASAHELFNGTSETTFSPDQSMSRGMLAMVLYNLEGRPEQDGPVTFSDVSSDAWYADSIAWTTAQGITGGYGNGQFGPNDNITREQFAVMLWKYMGSPEASGKGLAGFTDAGQASGYALEALSWAVENGILNGYGNGQLDPGGTATRAQAAQMLKNLMENT